MKINLKYMILAGVSVFVVAIDQITKMFIHTNYQLGESTAIVPGYFNITYVRNLGAAFGFLGQTDPAFRSFFFLAMPPFAMLIILLILRGIADHDRLQTFALSSVFGGAVGNYIDRVQFRYVIDFLDFHIKETYTWPAFNVADSAIVCGMIFLVLIMLKEGKNKSVTTASPSAGLGSSDTSVNPTSDAT